MATVAVSSGSLGYPSSLQVFAQPFAGKVAPTGQPRGGNGLSAAGESPDFHWSHGQPIVNCPNIALFILYDHTWPRSMDFPPKTVGVLCQVLPFFSTDSGCFDSRQSSFEGSVDSRKIFPG